MTDVKTCNAGHVHDPVWEQCPYCDESLTLPTEELPMITLIGWIVVLSGDYAGRDFRLERGSNLIGKADDCHIIIDDEYVSSHHARIEGVPQADNWAYVLTDLGSTNGTFLNESEDPMDQSDLADGDILTFGSTRAQFKSFYPTQSLRNTPE